MGERGVRVLAGVLAAHLAVSAWLQNAHVGWSDPVGLAVLLGLWVAVPGVLTAFACRSRRWARWALIGLYALRATGEVTLAARWVHLLGLDLAGVPRFIVVGVGLAVFYAALAGIVWRSPAVRRLVARAQEVAASGDGPSGGRD